MKITTQGKPYNNFDEVRRGACFYDPECDQYFMKLYEDVTNNYGDDLNAVCLHDGGLAWFDSDSMVRVLEAEVIIKG